MQVAQLLCLFVLFVRETLAVLWAMEHVIVHIVHLLHVGAHWNRQFTQLAQASLLGIDKGIQILSVRAVLRMHTLRDALLLAVTHLRGLRLLGALLLRARLRLLLAFLQALLEALLLQHRTQAREQLLRVLLLQQQFALPLPKQLRLLPVRVLQLLLLCTTLAQLRSKALQEFIIVVKVRGEDFTHHRVVVCLLHVC